MKNKKMNILKMNFILLRISSRQLTWRDVQHLTVLTAKRNQLFDPSKQHLWHINGAGLEFNHLFGFGVLDGSFIYLFYKYLFFFLILFSW
jgi:hypothetical protein